MPTIFNLEKSIKEMIDDLKGLCADNGLSNQAGEETVITTVFLYKFLNDKFMFNLNNFANEMGFTIDEIRANENDELDMMYDTYSGDVAFAYEDTIEYLINNVSNDNFYSIFDEALERKDDCIVYYNCNDMTDVAEQYVEETIPVMEFIERLIRHIPEKHYC